MESTYRFCADNNEPWIGYGSSSDAERFCQWLNRRKNDNLFWFTEVADLVDDARVMNLSVELRAIEDNDEEFGGYTN